MSELVDGSFKCTRAYRRFHVVISCSYKLSVEVKNGNTQYNIHDMNYCLSKQLVVRLIIIMRYYLRSLVNNISFSFASYQSSLNK